VRKENKKGRRRRKKGKRRGFKREDATKKIQYPLEPKKQGYEDERGYSRAEAEKEAKKDWRKIQGKKNLPRLYESRTGVSVNKGGRALCRPA